MTEASIIPASFDLHEQADDSFHSFNQSGFIPSLVVYANHEGWKNVTSVAAVEALQDKIDVEDSLQSLEEAKGVNLQDFKRQLGV